MNPLPPNNHKRNGFLRFKKALLVNTLEQLGSTDSMDGLRSTVNGVKDMLGDSKSGLRARKNYLDSVELPKEYLLGELDQIAAARSIDRAKYYVGRLVKSITQPKCNNINDLNLNRWKAYEDVVTDSLWFISKRDRSGAHKAEYWGNFVPQIPYQMMRRYTKKGDWVLDIFAGLGTTLIESRRLGRNCLGIELQSTVADQARALVSVEPDKHNVVAEVVTDDCLQVDYRALLQGHGRENVQLVILHPPYYDIIKFSDDERDLSNAVSPEHFLDMFGRAVENIAPLLEKGRHLVLVIGDKYSNGEWIPLGFQTMNEVLKRGFALKSVIVKNFEETTGKRRQKELWRYRALVGGFYIFKHEYIFVFKKR